MDPALQEVLLSGVPEAETEAIVKLADPSRIPPQLRIVSRFGDVATCRLPVASIPEVWADEAVLSLKAPRYVTFEPLPAVEEGEEEEAAARTRRHSSGWSGRGVAVGIVDWGFDFTHPNFLDPATGRTRFLAIWDQSAPYHPSARHYGYGRIYRRGEIDRALATAAPFETLGYHPAVADPDGSGAHGTHVLDIAAGSGAVGEPGVAPGAQLIAVHLSAGDIGGLATLGDSVRILEAIDFIAGEAGEAPLVINLSVGKHGDSHQGASLVEQGMDRFLREQPGRAIVNSAGNYYSARIHSKGRLEAGRPARIAWVVAPNDRTPNELEVWYSHRDRFRLHLQGPPGAGVAPVAVDLNDRQDLLLDGRLVGRAYHRAQEPNTGDHHINVFLYDEAPVGDWQVGLEGIDLVDGRYHAWIERDSGCRHCQSRFREHDAHPNYTTGSICNGLYTVAVGAYDPRSPFREAASFSSAGPTADGRLKPNVVAPGVGILAARSAASSERRAAGRLARKSGTSMAAPHVTGAIACLFEAVPERLPIEQTRLRLLSALRPPDLRIQDNPYQYGNGWLDLEALLPPTTPDRTAEAAHAKAIPMMIDTPPSEQVARRIHYVRSRDARLRTPPPALAETGRRLPIAKLVDVVQTVTHRGRTYVAVADVMPAGFVGPPPLLGWTLASNLRSNDATPLDWAQLKRELVRVANAEYDAWNLPTTRRETHSSTFDRQRAYWGIVGITPSNAQLGSTAWQSNHAWSAVFISWVVRQAGAGDAFFYSAAHSCYTLWARNNQQAGDAGNPFWAVAINSPEAAWPEPGDIICKNRAGGTLTLGSVACGDLSHCDIVVSVDRTTRQMITVGGNVDNRVARRRVTLSATGHVDPSANWTTLGASAAATGSQNQYYALIKVRTARPAVAAPPAAEAPEGLVATAEDFTPPPALAALLPAYTDIPEPYLVRLVGGERDLDALTDDLFYERHPELVVNGVRQAAASSRHRRRWNRWRADLDDLAWVLDGMPERTYSGGRPPGFTASRNGRGLARYSQDLALSATIRRWQSRAGLTHLAGLTSTQLRVLQGIANVEASGKLNGLNTWDSAFLSLGFMQLTLQHAKLHRWIAQAPAAFRRYGIALESDWQQRKSEIADRNNDYTGIAGIAKPAVRFGHWPRRFYLAALDPEVVDAEVAVALTLLQEAYQRLVSNWPAERRTIFDTLYNRSGELQAAVQESMNNLPNPARRGIRTAFETIEATTSLPDAARTLKQALLTAFGDYGHDNSWRHRIDRRRDHLNEVAQRLFQRDFEALNQEQRQGVETALEQEARAAGRQAYEARVHSIFRKVGLQAVIDGEALPDAALEAIAEDDSSETQDQGTEAAALPEELSADPEIDLIEMPEPSGTRETEEPSAEDTDEEVTGVAGEGEAAPILREASLQLAGVAMDEQRARVLFDHFALRQQEETAAESLMFEAALLPRQLLTADLSAGDLLLARTFGAGVALPFELVSGKRLSREEALAQGLIPDTAPAGFYTEVAARYPGARARPTLRRLTDSHGRALFNQLVLRTPTLRPGEAAETVVPDMAFPEEYGDYDLQRDDRDSNGTYGGATHTPAGHVQRLQEDLNELGFRLIGNPVGIFGPRTEMAVREFQIYAKMKFVAQEDVAGLNLSGRRNGDAPDAGYDFGAGDRLCIRPNTDEYTGPISGVVNAETRRLITLWKSRNWRCPLLVQGWRMQSGRRHRLVANNVWRHDEVQDTSLRFFVRDYSFYYQCDVGNDWIVAGDYQQFGTFEGPRSSPRYHHSWSTAEITPPSLLGNLWSLLTASQQSTFRVVRALAQAECEGYFDAVNGYDVAIISVGPCHWTLGRLTSSGNIGAGELGAYLAYLRHVDQSAFDKAVGNFGIRPHHAWGSAGMRIASQRKFETRIALQNQAGNFAIAPHDMDHYLHHWHWFYRFVMAGRTVEGYRRRMYHMTRIRIRDIRTAPIHNAGALTGGTFTAAPSISDVFTSERAVALLTNLHIIAPGSIISNNRASNRVRNVIRRAVTAEPSLTWNTAPATWTDAHQHALIDAILAEYSSQRARLNRTLATINIAGMTAQTLSRDHNSMQFDGAGLPP